MLELLDGSRGLLSAGLAWLLVVYPFATLPLMLGLVMDRRRGAPGSGETGTQGDLESEHDAEGIASPAAGESGVSRLRLHRGERIQPTRPVGRGRPADVAEPGFDDGFPEDADLEPGHDLLGALFAPAASGSRAAGSRTVPLGLPASSDLGAAAVRVLRSRGSEPWLREAAARLLVRIASDLPEEGPARAASGRLSSHRR